MPLYHIELVVADQVRANNQLAAYTLAKAWGKELFSPEDEWEVRVKLVPEEEDDDRMRWLYKEVTPI